MAKRDGHVGEFPATQMLLQVTSRGPWSHRRVMSIVVTVCVTWLLHGSATASPVSRAVADSLYDRRAQDWRNGAVVYLVIVDRFVPSANLDAKRALYPAPKVLHPWSDVPRAGWRSDRALSP